MIQSINLLEERNCGERILEECMPIILFLGIKRKNLRYSRLFAFERICREKWFDGFQTLIGYKDRDHVHLHLVATNTVSYEGRHISCIIQKGFGAYERNDQSDV